MKILILSITAGQGHNSTAAALNSYFESQGSESRILDTYNYLNRLLGGTVSRGYLLSVENAKTLYSTVYKRLEKRKRNANKLSATRLANLLLIKKLKNYIDIYDPDVIINTHIFSGIIIDIMKQRHTIRALTFGIVTDFTMHPYWEEGLHLDYIVIANELMIPAAKRKGYKDNQILPFGIPINPKFAQKTQKRDAKLQLNMDPSKLTLLIMGGSMGYGNIIEIIKNIDSIDLDFQIITVCGNNTELKQSIDKMETKKTIFNYGFTTNIDLLMDSADCLISKPGGLTTSEALAKDLPMIIINPIPGQEERNVEFLLNSGAAMTATDNNPVECIVYELFNNPEKLQLMQKSIKFISKPNSTSVICEYILNLLNK